MDANKMQKVKGKKTYKVIILMYCQANEFIYSFCRELWPSPLAQIYKWES